MSRNVRCLAVDSGPSPRASVSQISEPLRTPAASGRFTAEESEAAGARRRPLGKVPPATPRPAPGGHAPAPPTSCLEQSRLARSFKAAGGRRRACFTPSDAAEVAASPLRRRGDCREGRRDGGSGTRSRLRGRVKRGGSRSWSASRARAGGAGPRGPPGPGE